MTRAEAPQVRATARAMSSLLEHSFVRTVALERVVAPIATHLCYLVLLCDNMDDEYEQFSQLEAAALEVAKATDNMAAVVSRYVLFSQLVSVAV